MLRRLGRTVADGRRGSESIQKYPNREMVGMIPACPRPIRQTILIAMKPLELLMDAGAIDLSLTRITHQILERNRTL